MILQCDASLKGLGACILQDGKPIAFASKSLTDTETRYANIERELLDIVFGCKKFHTYLYGRSFVVESDHKPLEMICLKNLISAPVRLQRMLLRLQQYDMVITYRSGKEMLLTDALSHLPSRANNSEIKLDLRVNTISFAAFSSSQLTKTTTETQKDSILSTVHWLTLNGWPRVWRHIPRIARNYWDFWDELSIEGDLLMKGERIVIPTSCRDSILADLHRSLWRSESIPIPSQNMHLLARNGSRRDGLHQTVCDMHRQHKDSCRNLMSTWSPSRTMDQNRYGFLPRWFRTEIFNHCRLFLQVSVHLSCHIDTPPKDSWDTCKICFQLKAYQLLSWPTTDHPSRVKNSNTLQENLTSGTRRPHHTSIDRMDSSRWWSRKSKPHTRKRTDLRTLKREPYYSYAKHPDCERSTIPGKNLAWTACTRSCHAPMTQTHQHPENPPPTSRNSTDAEKTLRPSSPSQGWENPESERKSSILSAEAARHKTKVVDRDSDRNFGMRMLIHNRRPEQ